MPTNSDLLETARRRRFVLQKRRQGLSYADIAEAAVDEFGADCLPNGWGKRYAHKDVTRALQAVQDELKETAREVRTLELLRLNALYRGVAAAAESGDTDAVREARKIIKRRCRMLGLDEPEKIDAALSLGRSEEFQDALSDLMGALEDFPEARMAVARVLAEGEPDDADGE